MLCVIQTFNKLFSFPLMCYCFCSFSLLLFTIAPNYCIFNPALLFYSESPLYPLHLLQVCQPSSEILWIQYVCTISFNKHFTYLSFCSPHKKSPLPKKQNCIVMIRKNKLYRYLFLYSGPCCNVKTYS